MSLIYHISQSAEKFHFGGNWTDVNLKSVLSDITWEEAKQNVGELNTIAALTYHITYFIEVINRVLKGGSLEGNDKFSFDHPAIESHRDWKDLIDRTMQNARLFVSLINKLPEEKLWETFCDEKYGNYYQNIQGVIEHSHYHLGQITIIKKMIRS